MTQPAGVCTCHTYPAAHSVSLHDQNGQVVDVEMTPACSWSALHHATCKRCGWKSNQTWFADDFRGPAAQSHISKHRDRWTGECLSSPEPTYTIAEDLRVGDLIVDPIDGQPDIRVNAVERFGSTVVTNPGASTEIAGEAQNYVFVRRQESQ